MGGIDAESDAGGINFNRLIPAARDNAPIAGLTHNFYRYPARFSPAFVRAAIQEFSKPGDWIMDPFAGGGTTLVEALAAGRNALGIDISELATFVCEAKTHLTSDSDVGALKRWSMRLTRCINMRAPGHRDDMYASQGYYRNIGGREHWRLRKALEQALWSLVRLRSEGSQTIARCVVLKTAQWALDGRKSLPSVSQFRKKLIVETEGMVTASLEFRARVEQHKHGPRPEAICVNRAAAGLELDGVVQRTAPPKLVITSPPYPGIHVLYHRWQVDGRKEAPAPFWIADRLDGAGASYYTMGDRKDPELKNYFDNLEASFRSIVAICGPQTTIVQMVAFSQPSWQLPLYLEVMDSCGLQEFKPWGPNRDSDGRLWRDVPNRKWHADQKGRTPGSREVVLIHKKG